jgi:Na+-driven multidrug efflux pump
MNTRYLMIASALFMALIGLALTFAPEEIGDALGSGDAYGWQLVIMQLCGALYCGFALMNWMAKGALLGGIYGRRIVIGNLVHFTIGALALLKAPHGHSFDMARWTMIAIYALFSALFGYVMFAQPTATTDK